tara:strand:- start:66760 stop:67647 length:888 start_codon:yes stop_codon:yes gene_type:complete
MLNKTKCDVCNNDKFEIYLKSKDFSVSNENFNIVKCNKCNFAFTNPRPNDECLGKYYISDHYISHNNTSKSIFDKTYQFVRKYTLKIKYKIINSIKNKGSILDIGCGTGEFLNKFKEKGWKCKGIEPSKIARNIANKNYKLNIKEENNLNNLTECFDIITMWHVLEHVADLNNTISNLYRIINDNGKIIIAVPNIESFDAKIYGKYWAAYDLPIHLSHFSKKSITKIFENHKFNLIGTKNMFFDAYYISILSEEFKNGKKNIIKSFINGSISNIIGLITKRGTSSKIYIFEKRKN